MPGQKLISAILLTSLGLKVTATARTSPCLVSVAIGTRETCHTSNCDKLELRIMR